MTRRGSSRGNSAVVASPATQRGDSALTWTGPLPPPPPRQGARYPCLLEQKEILNVKENFSRLNIVVDIKSASRLAADSLSTFQPALKLCISKLNELG